MAERKIVQGGVNVLIQMYMEETCNVVFKQLADALWKEEEVERYFSLLCNEEQQIVIRDLKSRGLSSNKKFRELLLSALNRMGVTEDLDRCKFNEISTCIIAKVNKADKEFKGPEELEALTAQQMKLLLQHNFAADRGEIEAPDMLDDLLQESRETSSPSTNEKGQVRHKIPCKNHVYFCSSLCAPTYDANLNYQFFSLILTSAFCTSMQILADLEAGSSSAANGLPQAKEGNTETKTKKKRFNKKERQKQKIEEKTSDMEKEDLRGELRSKVMSMYKNGVLKLPPLAWDGNRDDERKAVREIGIFSLE